MTKTSRESIPADEGFSLISNQKLLSLYSTMRACRGIAEGSTGQRRSKGAGAVLGHEAAAVGTAIDLLPQDTVARGLWPEAVLKAINASVSIAESISLATRSAVADKHSRNVTLIFSPSKRSSQSSWRKALAVAAEQKLPILFVSLDGTETCSGVVDAGAFPAKRTGHALPCISVDGNDVVAVYRVAFESITHARKGKGPTLIDCQSFTTGDPLESMERYLMGKGLNPKMA